MQEPDNIDKNEEEEEEEEGPVQKRPRVELQGNVADERKLAGSLSSSQVPNPPSLRCKIARCNSFGCCVKGGVQDSRVKAKSADNSFLSKVPPEVFHDILKFLSSEARSS